MNHNINNTVVLVLNPEHGAEVIKAWKALGVDMRGKISVLRNYRWCVRQLQRKKD